MVDNGVPFTDKKGSVYRINGIEAAVPGCLPVVIIIKVGIYKVLVYSPVKFAPVVKFV